MHGARKKYSCLLTSKFPKSDMASVSLLSLLLLDGCNQTINKVIYKCVLSFLDCKTLNSPYFCVFKYAWAVKQKVWNEAENRERDWGETLKIIFFHSWGSRVARVRLLRHALPISLLILRKKPTVLQSISFQMLFSMGNYFSIEYYLVIKHCQVEGKISVQCVFYTSKLHTWETG